MLSLGACASSGGNHYNGGLPNQNAPHQAQKVIKTSRGYQLYLGGTLVDTMTFASSGAAVNILPSGKRFIERGTGVPPIQGRNSPASSLGGCGGGGGPKLAQINIDKQNVQSAQMAFAGEVLVLVSMFGVAIIAIISTGGMAALLAYVGYDGAALLAVAGWNALQTAQAQLSLDEQNAILQGCHM